MDKQTQFDMLKTAIDLRRVLQKSRIAYGLRINAIERGDDNATPEYVQWLDTWHKRLQGNEKEIDDEITEIAKDIQIIQHMINVNGVGFILASKIVSQIDIQRCETVSKLWRYAGYSVGEDGKAERRVKGEKSHYNATLKTDVHLIGVGLLRKNSPYRPIYDIAREKYDGLGYTKGHAHNSALRKVVKLWLSHLWEVWRSLEGLPIRPPYVLEHGGHTTKYDPRNFGWYDD